MSWIGPLEFKHKPGMPSTAREVWINHKRYPSMLAACKALKCSTTKIYYLIGEGWRNRGWGK